MYACRAALLLTALTCSAQATELVNFSADHVTIKVQWAGERWSPSIERKKMDAVPVMAARYCGAYGKYPREIARENIPAYSGKLRTGVAAILIHYACIKE